MAEMPRTSCADVCTSDDTLCAVVTRMLTLQSLLFRLEFPKCEEEKTSDVWLTVRRNSVWIRKTN